jgi:hypothetical protein
MVMALAGNKSDLEDKRKVTAEVSVIILHWRISNIDFYTMLVCVVLITGITLNVSIVIFH